jgi:hypothetical protein
MLLLQLVILKPVRRSWDPPVTKILHLFELCRPADEGMVLPSPRRAFESLVMSVSLISTMSPTWTLRESISFGFRSSPSQISW